MTILVTGGAGFIGSNFVLQWVGDTGEPLVNLDKLTYAGNPNNLAAVQRDPAYHFVHADICDTETVRGILQKHNPRAIVHFAAESHVDRSIVGPQDFIDTNVVGTFRLLEEVRRHFESMPGPERAEFRFLHVSTDEVYGSLGPNDPAFSETTPYAPNSPYSASKASSDHLVRAYHHTYGLPVVTSNCSNNYGPFQFPEKLIPLMILNALGGKSLPVYGDGLNVRDWLYVEDHCSALRTVLQRGKPGETYNIGGRSEMRNIDVVKTLCGILDDQLPESEHAPHEDLITFVKDRPGHDRRYAVDSSKVERELGWAPEESFESGLHKTVAWYLRNPEWVSSVTSGRYQTWIESNYDRRGAAI